MQDSKVNKKQLTISEHLNRARKYSGQIIETSKKVL